MGQAESRGTSTTSSGAHRRVDPRWGRVTLDQLRDEEFLTKQLRRMETIAGARHAATASGGRRQRVRPGLFANVPIGVTARSLGRRAMKDKVGDGGEGDEEAGSSGLGRRSADLAAASASAEQLARAEEQREDELLHALVLLGNVDHAERTALLLCHLKEQLRRYCVVSDPVAELLFLRKQILRDVHDAVTAQHQQQRTLATLAATTVATIHKAATRPSTTSLKEGSSSAVPQTTNEQIAQEASLAGQLLVELMTSLMQAGLNSTQQKRDFLQDVRALTDGLAPLSLAPKRGFAANELGAPGDTRNLVQELQRFLLVVARGGIRDKLAGGLSPRHSTLSEFDLADRTNALTCLLYLAAAGGSVRDMLIVVKILLGAGDHVDAPKESETSTTTSVTPTYFGRNNVVNAVVATKPVSDKQHQDLKEFDIDALTSDERMDLPQEMATFAVEQRLKQVHKQRIDLLPKSSDVDSQSTVDQVMNHTKKKAAQKGFGHQKAVVAHGLGSTASSLNHSAQNMFGSQSPANAKAIKGKDEVVGSLLGSSFTLPIDVATSSISRSELTIPARRDSSIARSSATCPKFERLSVGPVLKELDALKPSAPSRHVAQRSIAGGFGSGDDIGSMMHTDDGNDSREVWSCGQNSYGELGHGDTTTRKTFERVESLQRRDIVQVSAGNEHSIALTADGAVWTCGYNDNGQCGHGVTTRVCHMTELQKLGDTAITQVHAYNGCEHTILVTQDGRAASCGYNYRGQLGHGNTQSEGVPKIMRSIDGKIVRLVSCSYYHTVMACEGPGGHDYVYTFGRNDYGQLGHNDTIDRKIPQAVEALNDQHVISVACGQYHTMVVTSAGKLFAFGKNDYGQLGVDTPDNQLMPIQVRNGLDRHPCLEVRCGYYHSIVLCAGAHLFAFGRNDYGQLGLGKISNTASMNLQLQQQRFPLPSLIEDLEGKEIVRFACGCYHTIAVSDNGVLYVFGRNNHGQLGTGDTNERLYPYPIDDFVGKRVAMIAAGFYHTLVLTGGKDDDDQPVEEQAEAEGDCGEALGLERVATMSSTSVQTLSQASILSLPYVREYFDIKGVRSTAPTSKKTPGVKASRPKKTSRDSEDQTSTDPSCDNDVDDGSHDIPLHLDDTIEDEVALSATSHLLRHRDSSILSSSRRVDKGDSVDVAIIVLALLDKICTPYVSKRGVYPVSCQPPVSVTTGFLSSSDTDLSTLLDGCFEDLAIHITSSTFDSLCSLITLLSCKVLDPLIHSPLVPSSGKPSGSASNVDTAVQTYALCVCLRLLRAHLGQLVRSGMGTLLTALKKVSFDQEAVQERPPMVELFNIDQSLLQIRAVLLRLLDPSQRGVEPDHSPITTTVIGDAIETLMVGFDVFFPCHCAQAQLLAKLVDQPQEERHCGNNCSIGKHIELDVLSAKARRMLLIPVLKRMAEDSLVSKLLPLSAPSQTSLRPVRVIYKLLLERLNCEFIRTLSEAAASEVDADDASLMPQRRISPKRTTELNAPVILLLNAIQKHLVSWASSHDRWEREVAKDSLDTSLRRQLSLVTAQTFRIDPENSRDLPLPWRAFLEFAMDVVAQACDALRLVISRERLPSPCAGTTRFPLDTMSEHYNRRLIHAVEISIVGELLPSLVACLLSFTRTPVFAVSLFAPFKTLLILLDNFNCKSEACKSSDAEMMIRLGTSIPPKTGTPIANSKQKQGLRTMGTIRHGSGSFRSEKSASGVVPSKIPLAEMLSVPWLLELEKEVAILCAEMGGTVSSGHAMFEVPRGVGVEPYTLRKWQRSGLFKGGLRSSVVRDSVSERDTAVGRTVAHSPLTTVGPQNEADAMFSLVLPPPFTTDYNATRQTWDSVPRAICQDGAEILATVRMRRFVRAMGGMDTVGCSEDVTRMASLLCEVTRTEYAKKDASYRMLVRQSQSHHQTQATPFSPVPDERQMEDAMFAALLHHECRGLFAMLVAHSWKARNAKAAASVPSCFLVLWRAVAEMRRRFVTKRAVIKNSVAADPGEQVQRLQQDIVDRCHVLLLVNIDEEEEHARYQMDGGFIAPHDPAYSFRACTFNRFSSPTIRTHIATRFSDEQLPFLIAYPTSHWRRVRVIFHVTMRWKSATTTVRRTGLAGGHTPRVVEVLDFVTAASDEVGCLNTFAHSILIDPCRRLSCAARGFEMLWELITIPTFESITVCTMQQVATFLNAPSERDEDNFMSFDAAQTASLFYRELRQRAVTDFLTSVTQLIVKTAEAVPTSASDGGIIANSTLWSLLSLLRCWGLHFTEEHFEFVNDLGVVNIIQQLLRDTHSSESSADDRSGLTQAQNESIRAITHVGNKIPVDGVSVPGTSADFAATRMTVILWTLLRYVSVHFAAQPTQYNSPGAISVPIYTAAPDVFEALFTEFERLSGLVIGRSLLSIRTQDLDRLSVATSSALRRSVEIIVAPRRFSPLSKGLSFAYSDMVAPPPSTGRAAMSPLLKPNEFSITTWIFVSPGSMPATDPQTLRDIVARNLDEKYVVFVRGDDREISPYLLVTRDMEMKCQLEVGLGMIVTNSSGTGSAGSRRLWERMTTKDSFPTGKWVHVAIVLEGTKIRLYVNGILDNQRTIAAQHATAAASGSVNLNVHFGRCTSAARAKSPDDDSAMSGRPASDAVMLLSALMSSSSSTKNPATPTDVPPFKSFDGLLSHFRFHNRSLSPIHVRIVYDEKKPAKEDDVGGQLSTHLSTFSSDKDAQRLVQLHSLVRVLIESGEGRVHLLQPKWVAVLWDSFTQSNSLQIQVSSLRLLGEILDFQVPSTVDSMLLESSSKRVGSLFFGNQGSVLIQYLLWVVGASLCRLQAEEGSTAEDETTDIRLPVRLNLAHTSFGDATCSAPEALASTFELRNSTAMHLIRANTQRGTCVSLANEIVRFLVDLCSRSAHSWRRTVLDTFGKALMRSGEMRNEAPSADDSIVRVGLAKVRVRTLQSLEYMGCLYLLSGPVDVLRSGARVSIKMTREIANVIAVDDDGPAPPTVVKMSGPYHSVYVALEDPQLHAVSSPRGWYEQVFEHIHKKSVSSLQPAQSTVEENEISKFIRLNSEDIELRDQASLLDHLSAEEGERDRYNVLKSLICSVRDVDDGREACLPIAWRAMEKLKQLHLSGFRTKALCHAASSKDGATMLLRDSAVLTQVIATASRSDNSEQFATLDDVERKLWIVRTRLYQVLADLGDDAHPELEHWALLCGSESGPKLTQATSKAPVTVATSEVPDEKDMEDDRPEGVDTALLDCQTESLGQNELKVDDDLRLPMGIFDLSEQVDDRSQSILDGESDDPISRENEGVNAHESGYLNADDEGDDDDNDDDDGNDNDDDEGDGADGEEGDDEDEDEDDDAEENRQEFVDELMMMGFPEEWCVLALKQTENDIVSASAWIVDNLEYLSRLQTSLDKQRDQSTDNLAYNDDDDDNGEDGDRIEDNNSALEPKKDGEGVVASAMSQDPSQDSPLLNVEGPHSPSRPDGTPSLINDKEMGRKIFGEMYFPFEDGGYASNMKSRFFNSWQPDTIDRPNDSANPEEAPSPDQESSGRIDFNRFQETVDALELGALLDQVVDLEKSFTILSARRLLVTLCAHLDASLVDNDVASNLDCLDFLTVMKFVVLRGEQMTITAPTGASPSESEKMAPESVLRHACCTLVTSCASFTQTIVDFAFKELEMAATQPRYEAYLWTQRNLKRGDRVVVDEPSLELASWLFEIVLEQGSAQNGLSTEAYISMVAHFRSALRSTNLPVKFVALNNISRVLQQLAASSIGSTDTESLLKRCMMDFDGILHAAHNRLSREHVQSRTLFSLYLQAYVDVLLALRRANPSDSQSAQALTQIAPPIATSFFALPSASRSSSSVSSAESPSTPHLVFDRKKCRSSLLHISDDGLTVAYSGNEMWKMAVATQGFTSGSHEWQIRVEKSPSSYLFIGIASARANIDSFLGADDQSWGFIGDKALYYQRNRLRVYGDNFGEGDCIGVRLDCDLGTLSFTKNGAALGVAFENIVGEVFPAVAFYSRHQKLSLIVPTEPSPSVSALSPGTTLGTMEEAIVVCELMDCMSANKPVRPELMRGAFDMTRNWEQGAHQHVVTRAGRPLWVDITKQACTPLGFESKQRVRTPRGNGTVVGVADGRLWITVDGEFGAWHFHPSKLRLLALAVVGGATKSIGNETQHTASALNSAGCDNPGDVAGSIALPISITQSSNSVVTQVSMTEAEFHDLVHDGVWTLAVDRLVVNAVNTHCDKTSVSPWNISTQEVTQIVAARQQELESLTGLHAGSVSTRKLVARFGFLRFFNAYLSRVIGFFDLTWHYFAPTTSLQPCHLLAKCRGSIFTATKNEFFTALMDKTSNSPKKADDDYDYPDDLPQILINRPKAATAKCHPGTTKSLLLSMFGQAFEELHFLPLRTLRMVYSHPMDDGQLRSFKVKFEGEGVDDYGGPYREFFSQFFAELQMICHEDGGDAAGSPTDGDKMEVEGLSGADAGHLGTSFLPFLLPSPNWRNGVGSNREKFVLNGSILGGTRVGAARVVQEGDGEVIGTTAKLKHAVPTTNRWADSAEAKRQLQSEMCHFLGQMIGTCLRTRVCVRLDLAISVWKQLVGEDDGWDIDAPQDRDSALASLKEIDFVAYSLLKSLWNLHEEFSQTGTPTRRLQELEEELAAMDLTFTTYLSDGRLVELCENGRERSVTLENVDEYARSVLTARTNEAQDVVNVIKQGIHSIMPVTALALLTWDELEKRVCGVAEVDVELLKANTEYDEDLSANDECIQRFWRVLGAMDDEDKCAFLRFVWARSRLPVGTAQFHQKFKIQSLASSSANGNESLTGASVPGQYSDAQLPKSHTCFFALQLPRYSSDAICRKQLQYAIHNCVEMDGDFRLADTEMTGWTDINPSDQLRF